MKFILENIKPVICLEIGDLGVEGARKSKNVIDYVLNYGYEAFEFNNQLFNVANLTYANRIRGTGQLIAKSIFLRYL